MFPFLDEPVFKIVQEAASQLRQNTYVVGGYVRDFLLHRSSKDIDFVTLGSGIQLAEAVHHLVPDSKLCVFKNFGTAQIIWNGFELEFVGARKESYTRNSRKPIVENGSLYDDLSRRDFTVNALAVSINEPTHGQLIDLFSGLHDLNAGILKTPCDPDIRMIPCACYAPLDLQRNFSLPYMMKP
jgi:tRNA nucleotidyltransferase/poly(A) polymerase